MRWCELARIVTRYQKQEPENFFERNLHFIANAFQCGRDFLIEHVVLPQHVGSERSNIKIRKSVVSVGPKHQRSCSFRVRFVAAMIFNWISFMRLAHCIKNIEND